MEVGGLVQRPLTLSMADLRSLPSCIVIIKLTIRPISLSADRVTGRILTSITDVIQV